MGARLRQQWEALHNAADRLWEADQLTADSTNMPTIAQAQRTFDQHMVQYRFDTLLESVDAATMAFKNPCSPLQLCLPGVCRMAYSPAHGASFGAERCGVLRRHAAPAGHVTSAPQHGWHPLHAPDRPVG
jgi:hypothetical protein